ncbi:hypothetical protein L6164_009088 [Bauhinia variegata]|uniref:Uncharacterized protein n=1 Tax=Bauhinia variegata TaxID=167791 RepID=A0ACB9PHW6_BAUVA|nr:hypothetical protein L6164_009088 [Bauhinia variegata]
MEKLPGSVVNGGLKLPIGYRFCPTDEELVIHYLKRKALAQPLPASVIPEFDVLQTDPRGLPGVGDLKERRYFFSNRRDHAYGNISRRAAGSGYWKYTGKDKKIVVSASNKLVGIRKTLVFCEGKRSHVTNFRWIMHELRLVVSASASYPCQMSVSDWAVYRIFQKKRKLKRKASNGKPCNSRKVQTLEDKIKPSFIDFMVECGDDSSPPPPCSPCFSEGSDTAFNKF